MLIGRERKLFQDTREFCQKTGMQPVWVPWQAALPRNFFKITGAFLYTRKMGFGLGVFLYVAQIKKFFQIWQNDFLNLSSTEIGKVSF